MNKQRLYTKLITAVSNSIKESLASFNADNTVLNEMACMNLKDDAKSPFHYPKYVVHILNKEGNKIPHFHLISKSEQFDIRLCIDNGELLSVKKYGNRKRNDTFTDIIKLAKRWLQLKSCTDKFRTNQESLYYIYSIMNPDSPYNK